MCSFAQSSAGIVHPPPPQQGTTQHGMNTTAYPCTAPSLPPVNLLPIPIPIPGPSNLVRGPAINPTSFFNVQNDTLLLSAHTKDHVTRAIQGGWAELTLKHYTGTIKQFIRFCDAEHVLVAV